MIKPQTYLDGHAGVELEPKGKPQLLFDAWLNHGPGHDENLSFLMGPDSNDTKDVLWLSSDMADQLSAIAWLPKGVRSGKSLYQVLILAYWQREKEENDMEEPNFTEILDNPSAALSSKEIHKLGEEIWPPVK